MLTLLRLPLILSLALWVAYTARAEHAVFQAADVFGLQWVADPQISQDGQHIVYVRQFAETQADRFLGNLWIIKADGSGHEALTTGSVNASQPRWSPDGSRIAYVGNQDGSNQLYVRWVDSGREARIAQLPQAPGGLSWSPDGTKIAFSMFVPEAKPSAVTMPAAPKGAQWAERARYIDTLIYRRDGSGYAEAGYRQIFVVPADGGAPQQLTDGAYHHGGSVSWTPDSKALVFAANRRDDADYEPRRAQLYRLTLADGALTELVALEGPASSPVVSPDGKQIAFRGYTDRELAYQQYAAHVINSDGSNLRSLGTDLDRSIDDAQWSTDGRSLFVLYDDGGTTRIAALDMQGRHRDLAADIGGTSLGRPYSGGSFSVARNGRLAYNLASAARPAELAVQDRGGAARQLTRLNETLLGQRQLGTVETLNYQSSVDQRPLQGWIIKPPGFDPSKRYPLLLEIHGGPHANYGERFAVELQAYATAGFVVLYTNPRGSTGYGEEFATLIHHAFPGHDHDDLMDGIDAVIAKGYVDPERLFITGGSGGGTLTSWAIGMTDRFRAAVVQKPVINWLSFAYTTDIALTTTRYWFGAMPWEDPEAYLRRSPISLIDRVQTPTMVLTGESDWRTPMSESEQYYQALKLRRVDAALVRIPGAPHSIGHRPSNMIEQILHIIAWFKRYDSAL